MPSTDVLDKEKFVSDAVRFLTMNRDNTVVFDRKAIARYFHSECQTGKLTPEEVSELLERTLNSFPELELGQDESGEYLLRGVAIEIQHEASVWRAERERVGF